MIDVDDSSFEQIVADAIDNVPKPYSDRLQNIAFIIEDEPSVEQRRELGLGTRDSLFGLYEGAPLPTRGGQTKILPDKITLFKKPLLWASRDLDELKQQVGRTVWHEVAHYFGLDHRRIEQLEAKPKNRSSS